jgi:hypothetical protein
MIRRASSIAVLAMAFAFACEPIVPTPRLSAPTNTCQCGAYTTDGVQAQCTIRNRCEIGSASGHPDFQFWIAVHVPDTSPSAPGLTYVLASDAQGSLEASAGSGTNKRCKPPLCLPLSVAATLGRYIVTAGASHEVGYPLTDGTRLPVRVVYESTLQRELPALPLDDLFATSTVETAFGAPEEIAQRLVPFGSYRRVFYPEPPFDAYFPPKRDDALSIAANVFADNFTLGSVASPSPSPKAKVSREEGLDGWRVWLVDKPSQRRISVVRTLSGTVANDVPLYMTGEALTDGSDRIQAVVAPPENWTAVPRFVTQLFSGQGLEALDYPRIPAPVTVNGVVAQRAAGVLLGFSAAVSFVSQTLSTTTVQTPLLQYSTSVHTDDRGRFATVLPPGKYLVTVNPAEGTGYAAARQIVDIDRAVTGVTLEASPRTLVKGRALVADGRPLLEAEVMALPSGSASATPSALTAPPRIARTRTDDNGSFSFDLDPGTYMISVVPKAGTGFPRVVFRTEVPTSRTSPATELPDVRIPAPMRLAFSVRDTTTTENPISNAVVQIFTRPRPGADGLPADPVEIGNALTDDQGAVELLFSSQPR